MSDQLPSALTALARSLRLGFRTEPKLLVAGFVTTVAAALPDALVAICLAKLADAVVQGSRGATVMAAAALGILATASWLFDIVSERVNLRLTDRAAVGIESHMARLHSAVPTIEHYERPSYVDRLTLIRDHASTLSELYQMLFSCIGVLLRLAITIGMLVSIRPALGLLGLFAVPPILIANWRSGAEKRTEEACAQHERRARSLFLLGTTPDPAKEVRIGQVQDLLVERSAAERLARYRNMARSRSVSAAWTCAAFALFGAALVAAVAVTAHGRQAAGDVVLVVAAGGRLSQYLSQTVRETHLFRAIWLDGSRKLAWLEDLADASAEKAVEPAPAALADGIRLEGVSFRYPETDRDVLRDVNLTLPAGTVVAVVGENGAGKTSLVKLLCGMYAPTAGRITIDGVGLDTVSTVAWRSRTTGAFQDFMKFEYSVAESVGLGDVARMADPAAVRDALERADATGVVAKLPRGVDSQLGAAWQDGTELSHGQWQRIALARSFMRERPLLVVLDEPTSAFDAHAEEEIFARYAAAAEAAATDGQVTVLVSHRFSTVRMADLIVVLDGAGVAETGSHAKLMARGGLYAELYTLQAAAYAASPAADRVAR